MKAAAAAALVLLAASPALAQVAEVEGAKRLTTDYGVAGIMLAIVLSFVIVIERRAHLDRKEHAAVLKAERDDRAAMFEALRREQVGQLERAGESAKALALAQMTTQAETTKALNRVLNILGKGDGA